jgi:hypothetical protein
MFLIGNCSSISSGCLTHLTYLIHCIHTLLDYAQIEQNIGYAASFLIKHEKKSGDWTY